MLSIEYIHKRIRFFRIEFSLMVVACLAVLILLWQLLGVLQTFNKAFFLFFLCFDWCITSVAH